MVKLLRTSGLAIVVLLLAAGAVLEAQLPGSLYGQIFDENEQPIEGVTITVTDPERPDFKEEATSNKKGRYKVHLANATVPYVFAFTRDGFQTFRIPNMRVPARQNTRKNFTMQSVQAVLEQAAEQSPGEAGPSKGGPISIYNEGVQALNAGDVATAKQRFLDAIDKKPDLASAHAAIARVYLDEGAHADAVRSAEEALRLSPEESTMYQVLYNANTQLGETEKAEAALAKMQASDPESAGKNLFNRAADLYNAGEMEQAKPIFEQILQSEPDHAKVHYMLGLCYVNSGQNTKAREHLTRFAELAPDDPDTATAREMIKYLN